MMQMFMLVVLAEAFDSTQGTLFAFEDEEPLFSFPVVLGRRGMAWGRGVHAYWMLSGPHKEEGDGKTPAGLFTLGTAFGKKRPHGCRYPFLEVKHSHRAIDDPSSLFYNTIVCNESVLADWKSAEVMFRSDELYDFGIVIDHNASPVTPGRGSCIFFHLWRSPTSRTEGCTAMERENLLRLLEWLGPKEDPLLLQLPKVAYPSFLSALTSEPIRSKVQQTIDQDKKSGDFHRFFL